MPKPQQQPKTTHQPSSMVLLAAQGFALSKHQANDSDTPTVRTFSGIANSGKPFYRWGEASIVDLSDITFKDKIPALDGHDRDKRCGVATLSVENHQLVVSGYLLGNDYGQAVATDADGGFPWQLSVHVQSDAVTELSAGQSETVNGQTVTGPIAILGKNKIREVSFTPTGVDDDTSAIVLSDDSKSPLAPLCERGKQTGAPLYESKGGRDNELSNEKEQTTMTLEQALAKIDTLQETIKTLKAALAEAKKAAKQADVNSKLSAAGFKPTGDGDGFVALSGAMYQALLSADEEATTAMIADLTAGKPAAGNKPPIPEALLSETTVPGGDNQAGGDALDKILTDKGVYSCRKI